MTFSLSSPRVASSALIGRPAAIGVAVLTLMFAFSVASAQAVLVKYGALGGTGSGAGQLKTPMGVGINQSNGNTYVADSGNARVDEFNLFGGFVAAWGWGVADGKAQLEVCTSSCRAGIAGSGVGQFSSPTTVAVDSSGGASNGDVYVGDAGNNVVDQFDGSGHFLSSIDGSTTPRGKYVSLAGVAVDQSGNVWTADSNTSAITAFDNTGNFIRQWNDTYGSTVGITVDSANGKVYLIQGGLLATDSWSLTGTNETRVDNGFGTALALDPKTGNLYVAHFGDLAVYDKTAARIDSLALAGSNPKGAAFDTIFGGLYVSDATANNVTIYGPPATPAAPLVGNESAAAVTTSGATLNASVFPFGLDTTCTFEYVDAATFAASGYANAASVPCSPDDLGSSLTAFQSASAGITGLSPATTYHFRVVAINSKGTVDGADMTFETQGPPAVGRESSSGVTDVAATLNASVDPTGLDTTCSFQYVSDATFASSGYTDAMSVPCSSADLGSSFAPRGISAAATGLTPGTLYHFRVVATNSAGTTNGADMTFSTHVSFLVAVGSLGGPGSGSGQLQSPVGVGVDQSSGAVFVADSGNARVIRFNASGGFVSAIGWGVRDGANRLEVCTNGSGCRAGIAGSDAGQFQTPSGVAVDSSSSPSAGDAYVADSGNNVVDKFDPAGHLLAVLTGDSATQGAFQGLSGVAVDQGGNLWVTDGGTGNVVEFGPTGSFVQQWSVPSGAPSGIAVDSRNDGVYVINGNGFTQRFSTTGAAGATVDTGFGGALSLDPNTGNVYVDHGRDVAVYDHNGTAVDQVWSLGSTTSSQGLAFRSRPGNAGRLYLSDQGNSKVAVYGPRAPGGPFISNESANPTARTTATLSAAIVPFSHPALCLMQYVDDATFMASGYTNATTTRCTPAALGASFDYQTASANIGGLTANSVYHFRAISVSRAGTTAGVDTSFQQPPANWPTVDRCPVDDPSMLATNGVNTFTICALSTSPHGSFTIGNLTVPTGNTNIQIGVVSAPGPRVLSVVTPLGGAIVADPVQIPSLGLTAQVESAGAPSNFKPLAGFSVGMPIITIPIKIHLTSTTLPLGPSCFTGSDQNPIVLSPASTDVSRAQERSIIFDPNGLLDSDNGPIASLELIGTTQADNAFALPGATGCGPNGDGSLDSTVNSVVGLPSPAGNNRVVLDDAASSLVLASRSTGQQFADFWHVAFG